MSLKDKKVTGSLVNFSESDFDDFYKKEDVDEAVAELRSKIECEMRRLEKSRDKVNQLEDEVTWRMWDDMISGLSLSFEIIKEVFE